MTTVKEIVGIKWWERLLLKFVKPFYSVDWGSSDVDYIIESKNLFGKLYLTKIIINDKLNKKEVLEELRLEKESYNKQPDGDLGEIWKDSCKVWNYAVDKFNNKIDKLLKGE